MSFKCTKHAQSGILNNLKKKPPNLKKLQTIKTKIDVVQRFYWFSDKPKMFGN